MTCKFHPFSELQPLPPEKELKGTRLRCPIVNERTGLRCSCVEVLDDNERVEVRRCARCGKRLGTGEGLSLVNSWCGTCTNASVKQSKKKKWMKIFDIQARK